MSDGMRDAERPFSAQKGPTIGSDEREAQIQALATLVYGMQMQTWTQTPEQKAKWFYEHGVRVTTLE